LSIQQIPAARTVLALLNTFEDLPAATSWSVDLIPSAHYALGVAIAVHGDDEAFEAWRSALGLVRESMRRREHTGYYTLTGSTEVEGVPVELTGYLNHPAALRSGL
ncbi:hypothetical protein, partial [Streptacidiphilus monticola]